MTDLIIGLDGVGEQQLKHFQNIHHPKLVDTVLPPITSIAWTSIFTGATPEEHGVDGFMHPDNTPFTMNSSKKPFIWDKKRCTAVAIPFWQDNGVVTSAGSKVFGGFPFNLCPSTRIFQRDKTHEIMREARKSTDEAVATLQMHRNPRNDLDIIVFTETDIAGHKLLGRDDQYYENVMMHFDNLIPKLAKGYDNVRIVSDHGMMLPKFTWYPNQEFEELGFLRASKPRVTRESAKKLVPAPLLGLASKAKALLPKDRVLSSKVECVLWGGGFNVKAKKVFTLLKNHKNVAGMRECERSFYNVLVKPKDGIEISPLLRPKSEKIKGVHDYKRLEAVYAP